MKDQRENIENQTITTLLLPKSKKTITYRYILYRYLLFGVMKNVLHGCSENMKIYSPKNSFGASSWNKYIV